MEWIEDMWNAFIRFVIRQATILGYFFAAIIFFGGCGVSIPWVLEWIRKEPHNIQSNNQNFITYYVALFASACLDLLLKLIDGDDDNKKPKIVWLLILGILFCLGTGYLLIENIDAPAGLFIPWVLGATAVSWIFWYGVHYKDAAFNVANTLGGSTSKPLTNG